MSKQKIDDKTVKKVIQEKSGEYLYTEEEICEISEIIVDELKNAGSVDETVYGFLAQYLYYSEKDKKYFFNLKRKQTKNKETFTKLLSQQSQNKCISEEEEVDSEELANLEKELIGINSTYIYPSNIDYTIVQRTAPKYGPFGTQWVKDLQVDDNINSNDIKIRTKKFDQLRKIVLPEQRSEGWFKMRESVISASDGGTAVGMNKHEAQYNLILKKTVGSTFKSNKFCYHGKKFEEIATMIYQYRMNVTVDEFGLMAHPTISFLGASPDGICNQYKLDGIHKSKYVGRMLEIKCPLSRKIQKEGPIIDNICPVYYWVQVQLQLECCDLDECDFWQCDIHEYDSRDAFIEDTNPKEPFRSKLNDFEKGVLIQLLPKKRMNDIENGKYADVVYEDAVFIYPPKIEMTPFDCDLWVTQTLTSLHYNSKYKDYYFDKIIYWKLNDSFNVTILRDKKWFAENLPILENMWRMITFFRNHKDKLDLWVKYIDSRLVKKTKDIMNAAEHLCDENNKNYQKLINDIVVEIDKAIMNKKMLEEQEAQEDNEMKKFTSGEFMFLD